MSKRLQIMDIKKICLLVLVITIYLLLGFFRLGGLMAYVVPSICWSLLAIIAIYICGPRKIRLWFSKPLTTMAVLIALLQISALVFSAFFTAFGRSPYAHTPIAIMIGMTYFSSALFGMEFSRAYLIKSCPKRKVSMGIILVALLFTFISIPLTRFIAPKTPVETAEFIGSEILPTLAQSLLATYLALFGGPIASISYLGTLQAFEWLSPILPNPEWPVKALIATLIPMIGYSAVNEVVNPFKLTRIGITSRSRAGKKSSSLSWIAVAIIAVIMVWGPTGLLGFQPTIVASGSMRPALDVGDIVIIVQAHPDTIKVGDIIQYRGEGEPAPTIHRVIKIYKSEGITYIVTKGDANDVPDEPIMANRIMGKVVFKIPKLGWISIYLKKAIADAWISLASNPTAYATIGITSVGLAIAINRRRSHRFGKMRGKLKR
ncbi:MAG: signal peptidase I [Thermoplasmata archaeon]|nr:MAG: signal peptidase I [Thermoplasmata archaeon]